MRPAPTKNLLVTLWRISGFCKWPEGAWRALSSSPGSVSSLTILPWSLLAALLFSHFLPSKDLEKSPRLVLDLAVDWWQPLFFILLIHFNLLSFWRIKGIFFFYLFSFKTTSKQYNFDFFHPEGSVLSWREFPFVVIVSLNADMKKSVNGPTSLMSPLSKSQVLSVL